MTAFHQKTYKEREQAQGKEAEAIYLQVNPLGGTNIVMGLRAPGIDVRRLSRDLAQLPDFYNVNWGILVEVQGCGWDKKLKVKEKKMDSLHYWHENHNPVNMFAWNSSVREWVLLTWDQLVDAYNSGTVKAYENDGNVYSEIPWEILVQIAEKTGRLV